MNHGPYSLPQNKPDSTLSLLSASCPSGIDLIMRVTLKCKWLTKRQTPWLLCEQLGIVQNFQPERWSEKTQEEHSVCFTFQKPRQEYYLWACEDTKCRRKKGRGFQFLRRFLRLWTLVGGGFDPHSPESLADSCSRCPIPLVSLSSSSVNLTTLVTSTHGKPLPTAKMMLS